MKTHYSLALCFVVLSAPSIVFAEELIDWKVGTKFSYIQKDLWNKEINRWQESVVRKDGENFVVEYTDQQSSIEYIVSPTGNYTRPMPRAAGTFSYTLVKIPMIEGAEWDYRYHYIGSNMNMPAQISRQCKAGKMEELEVPAGKFSARKYECKGSWTSTAGSAGTGNKTAWFAPNIGVVIKSIDTSQYFGGRDQNTFVLDSIQRP